MLTDVAIEWGYSCEISCAGCPAGDCNGQAVAAGTILTNTLRHGITICSSDLSTICNNSRIGVVKRSVMVVINLDGSTINYGLEDGRRLAIPAGAAIAFFCSDDMRLTAAYQNGERSRLLVIQCCPSNLMDQHIAEQIDAHLTETTFKPLLATCRARMLAQELFAPNHSGLVGQWLAESCALELLARAVEDRGAADLPTTSSLHPRDVAKIHELRDKLLLNLDAEHHLTDLARDIGMSTSTLKSKFVAVTGQPVFKFLRDQRLKRARDGLQHEGWTVSQAAYYVGYRHPTNFATAYRKRFGMAPTASRTAS
jgi:AraC-like DNA-binding protein